MEKRATTSPEIVAAGDVAATKEGEFYRISTKPDVAGALPEPERYRIYTQANLTSSSLTQPILGVEARSSSSSTTLGGRRGRNSTDGGAGHGDYACRAGTGDG